MSSLVLMRVLESTPARYDRGMRWLSLGRWERRLDAMVEAAALEPGGRVLEIGCGTGALTARLLARGAHVLAIDQNPQMLDLARARLADDAGSAGGSVELRESTAAEIDGLEAGSFDAVAASLVLSEMSHAEREFVLRQASRLLRPGGRLVIGDEVVPRRAWQRVVHALLRLPLALLTWVLTGGSTRAVPDLVESIEAAKLRVREETRGPLGSYALVIAEQGA